MKKILSLLSAICLLLAACTTQTEKRIESYVFDMEEVLTEEQEQALNATIEQFEKETTNEIAIVTTSNIGEHEKMVSYAVEFGDSLGVGKKDKDNGLVIVFSSKLRETFISTGYGTENILTDPICKNIVDSIMIPEFKAENYFEGLNKGLNECIRIWKENE